MKKLVLGIVLAMLAIPAYAQQQQDPLLTRLTTDMAALEGALSAVAGAAQTLQADRPRFGETLRALLAERDGNARALAAARLELECWKRDKKPCSEPEPKP